MHVGKFSLYKFFKSFVFPADIKVHFYISNRFKTKKLFSKMFLKLNFTAKYIKARIIWGGKKSHPALCSMAHIARKAHFDLLGDKINFENGWSPKIFLHKRSNFWLKLKLSITILYLWFSTVPKAELTFFFAIPFEKIFGHP